MEYRGRLRRTGQPPYRIVRLLRQKYARYDRPAPELPITLGTNVPRTNNTDLKTYGWELSVGWNDRLRNGLGYGVKLMLSDSQTEITRYPNKTGVIASDTYRKGMKMGEIWGYTTVGIAKDPGRNG